MGRRATVLFLLTRLTSGCYLSHQRDSAEEGGAAAVDAGRESGASLPLDATFDTSRPPPSGGCPSFPDASFEPDRTWDGGARIASPPRGADMTSDGTSFAIVWGEDLGRALHFARVSFDGEILARSVIGPATYGGRLLPAISWNGAHYAVSYSLDVELFWLELDANGAPLRPTELAATDQCSFHSNLLWSGDRWTRVTVTDDEPSRVVVTQMFPGGGTTSHVLDDVVANACDTVGLGWNGRELAVVWNDWSGPDAEMRFLRLDRDGTPIEGSRRVLDVHEGRSHVLGFDIVWTGDSYVAGGANTPWLRVSDEGDVLDRLGYDEINQSMYALTWDGCNVLTAFDVNPSFSYGYAYIGDEGVRSITLGYGTVGEVAVAVGAGGEAGFVMQRTNGVFYRRIAPEGPIGDWRALDTAH